MMVNIFKKYTTLWELKKIENNQMRNNKYNQKIDRRKRTLRSLLNLDKKSVSFGWETKEKDAPGNLYKASTDNVLFFNREIIFTIYKRAKLNNGTYLAWVE